MDHVRDTSALTKPSERLGRYVVHEHLGTGGMGTVVAAYDPELDRKVAVKVLRGDGPGGREDQSRLLREARAMARLSHRNVVTVHDVGLVDEQVFVAMELIDGETLASWLKSESRTWREILRMFLFAGRGLAAAHAAGLVHRDFKPDNVMIAKDGRVCVTDFGLARPAAASDVARADGGVVVPETDVEIPLTHSGIVTGTPAYMAPEQFLCLPPDARADQFSFCAALYEALHGKLAFEGDNYLELADSVINGRVRDTPAGSKVPGWVNHALTRGLRVQADERFADMPELLRKLDADPVARRQKWLAVTAAVVLLGLGSFAAGMWVDERCKGSAQQLEGVWDQARREVVHKAFAATNNVHAEETFHRVAGILDTYAAGWVAARTDTCEATHVRGEQSGGVLDLRMACMERQRSQMARMVEQLGEVDDSAGVDKAVQAVSSLPSPTTCEGSESLSARMPLPTDVTLRERVEVQQQKIDKAVAMEKTGQYKKALAVAETVAKNSEEIRYAPLRARALYTLGTMQAGTGKLERANETLKQAIFAATEARDLRVEVAAWNLRVFVVGVWQRKPDEALEISTHAEMAVMRAGATDTDKAQFYSTIASIKKAQGKLEPARKEHMRALALYEQALGPNPLAAASTHSNLGSVLAAQQKFDDAFLHIDKARLIWQAQLGPRHPKVGSAHNNLGALLQDQGKWKEASEQTKIAVRIYEQAVGKEHPKLGALLTNLGTQLGRQKKYGEATPILKRALAISKATLGADNPRLSHPLNAIGGLLAEQGKLDEALPYLEQAWAVINNKLGPDHRLSAIFASNVGLVLSEAGRHDEAIERLRGAVASLEKALGKSHGDLASPLTAWGESLTALGKPQQAVPLLERALRLRHAVPTDPEYTAGTQLALARALPTVARARAVKLAKSAQGTLAKKDDADKKLVAKVNAWLTAHTD